VRAVGFDVHLEFCEVAIAEGGAVRSPDTCRQSSIAHTRSGSSARAQRHRQWQGEPIV